MLNYDEFENTDDGRCEGHVAYTKTLPLRLEPGDEALEPEQPLGALEQPGVLGVQYLKPVTAWTGDHAIVSQLLEPIPYLTLLDAELFRWWGSTELALVSRPNQEHPEFFRVDIWAHVGCAADIGQVLKGPLNCGKHWIRVRGGMGASIELYLSHRWAKVERRDEDGGPIDLASEMPLWAKESKRAAYEILCGTPVSAAAHRLIDWTRDGGWWGRSWNRWEG
jgi:hypothetical protein